VTHSTQLSTLITLFSRHIQERPTCETKPAEPNTAAMARTAQISNSKGTTRGIQRATARLAAGQPDAAGHGSGHPNRSAAHACRSGAQTARHNVPRLGRLEAVTHGTRMQPSPCSQPSPCDPRLHIDEQQLTDALTHEGSSAVSTHSARQAEVCILNCSGAGTPGRPVHRHRYPARHGWHSEVLCLDREPATPAP